MCGVNATVIVIETAYELEPSGRVSVEKSIVQCFFPFI